MIDQYNAAPDALAELTAGSAEVRRRLLRLVRKHYAQPHSFARAADEMIRAQVPKLAESIRAGQLLTFFRVARQTLKETVLPERFHDSAALPAPILLTDGNIRGAAPSVTFPRTLAAANWLRQRIAYTPAEFKALDKDAQRSGFTVARIAAESTVGKIRNVLADSYGKGWSVREFQDLMMDTLDHSPLSPAQLETLFRTHTGRAGTTAKVMILDNEMVRDEFPYYLYTATHDSVVRDEHLMMEKLGLNGTAVYRTDDPVFDEFLPPWSWNCVLPGTVIEGKVSVALKSNYSGEAVEIVTRKGNRLRVTANHPVLTPKGFVAAKSIRKGNDLISYSDGVEGKFTEFSAPSIVMRSGLPNANVKYAPTFIEKVFHTLANLRPVGLFPCGANDLHGEGKHGNGKVKVVRADGLLLSEPELQIRERIGDLLLPIVNVEAANLAGFSLSDFGKLAPLLAAPTGRVLSDDGIPPNGIGTNLSPLKFFNIGKASDLHASLYETATDDGVAATNLARNLQQRFPSVVTRDEVIEVRNFNYSGHVYDLQSPDGWIVASSIVVSNCRCAVLPLSVEDAAAYGCEEAIEWMRTGQRPERPQFVPHPPFDPPPGWVPTGRRLSPLYDSRTVSLSALHAPAGGATVAGIPFKGGQFIPADVAAKASVSDLAKLGGRGKKMARKKAAAELDKPAGSPRKMNSRLVRLAANNAALKIYGTAVKFDSIFRGYILPVIEGIIDTPDDIKNKFGYQTVWNGRDPAMLDVCSKHLGCSIHMVSTILTKAVPFAFYRVKRLLAKRKAKRAATAVQLSAFDPTATERMQAAALFRGMLKDVLQSLGLPPAVAARVAPSVAVLGKLIAESTQGATP